jgi:hypothetical protein
LKEIRAEWLGIGPKAVAAISLDDFATGDAP